MIGRSIGNYQIVRLLGEGAMGAVYMAVHPRIGKRVAIKVLHRSLCGDPELVSRFFQEARSVNEIGHPNIVDISDFGETEDGLHYLVMELLDGETLRQRLDRAGPLDPEAAVAVTRQVAAALGAAHKRSVVHRDLKPDNVFIVAASEDSVERIKLLDFGVAKLVGPQGAAHKTAAGAVVGTPHYMAPEQVLGRPVDARSDVYALGVLLYEMVTGRLPFESQHLIELLTAVAKTAPPPPSRQRPGLPSWLDAAVLRCLEKDPAARPQTMSAFAATLAPPGGPAPPPISGIALALPVPQPAAPRAVTDEWATGATMAAPADLAARVEKAVAAQSAAAQPAPPAAALPSSPAVAGRAPIDGDREAGGPARTAPRVPLGGVARRERASRAEGLRALWTTFVDLPPRRRLGVGAAVVGGTLAAVASVVGLARGTRPPPPAVAAPAPQVATLHLDSRPSGAEVVRLYDGQVLGRAPVQDRQPADGRRSDYLFRLAGHVDRRETFYVKGGGDQAITAVLEPEAELKEVGTLKRSGGSKRSRRSSRSDKDKGQTERAAKAAPIAAPLVDPPPAPAPAARNRPAPVNDGSGLPPLLPSVRVKKLGRQ